MKVSSKALALLLSFTTTTDARKLPFVSTHQLVHHHHHQSNSPPPTSNSAFVRPVFSLRGGESTETEIDETAIVAETKHDDDVEEEEEEESLEDKVHAAMRRLGLSPDGSPISENDTSTNSAEEEEKEMECKDGVCELPKEPKAAAPLEDAMTMTKRLSSEMEVDETIVYAALGATMTIGEGSEEERLNEDAAREMIQNEMSAIARVMEDCDEVKELVAEGHGINLSRRALAFAEMNVEIARAILLADQEDGEAEEEAAKQAAQKEAEEAEQMARQEAAADAKKKRREEENAMKTVTVDANFDPTKPASGATPATSGLPGLSSQSQPPQGAPKPAKKEDVVFQATASTIQKLIFESPVPILLDVYADWCGPCKALTPALEEMAMKAGGMFRLIKLNTDEERNISSALEVTSLPTVFGIRDGKIVNMFQGMPRNETFMKEFMMGLLTGGDFNPKVTEEQQTKFGELSNKLIKIAGSAGFSFSQRERLQVRTNAKLDELVEVRNGNMADAEESAKVVRSLLSNIIRDPFEIKYRRVNLENKLIAARIGKYPCVLSILKSVGFGSDAGGSQMILGRGKKVVNVAPLVVARDTIDKWIDMNRRAIATALRKKQDELAREKLQEDAEEVEDEYDSEEEEIVDPNACTLKLRVEGKKKIHDVELRADDPLSTIIDHLPSKYIDSEEEYQITCAARRLIVKSNNSEALGKSLRDHKLSPAASIVVKFGSRKNESSADKSSLKERAAARKAKSKGEHTMQSIGIYSKDDNAKAELIDGGGGVWYEQDITEDEAEDDEDEPNGNDENTDENSE